MIVLHCLLFQSLFLPMRGYEGYLNVCAGPNLALLFLPMRGYEEGWHISLHSCDPVISPHEGLWASVIPPHLSYNQCYFSPWGVMRYIKKAYHEQGGLLFLPMRGYELLSPLSLFARPALFLPMRGYESRQPDEIRSCLPRYFSPWGVMSDGIPILSARFYWLFFPMRGYERGIWLIPFQLSKLFLPMRGYEINFGRNYGLSIRLFLPMRGYESLQRHYRMLISRLFLPMRGYETRVFVVTDQKEIVISTFPRF